MTVGRFRRNTLVIFQLNKILEFVGNRDPACCGSRRSNGFAVEVAAAAECGGEVAVEGPFE